MLDKEEEFEDTRNIVEYHASFIEPEAVRKIREGRDNSVEVPHEEFVAGIEEMFGRKIDLSTSKENRGKLESVSIDPKEAIRKAEEFKKKQKHSAPVNMPKDYRHWLNMELE